jgi:plastocyanin
MYRFAVFLLASMLPVAAHASTMTIDIRGADGAPLAGAVVMVQAASKPPGPIRFAWPNKVSQQNISFQPHVLIVPVGASVSFPNLDKVRHHVYSFSKPKKFDLKLYGQDVSRSVTFDQPGLVALGCNIHDTMSGFIWVVDTPFAAQSDAAGRVSLAEVPAGAATITVWHPSIKAAGNLLNQKVAVGATAFSTTLSIRRG